MKAKLRDPQTLFLAQALAVLSVIIYNSAHSKPVVDSDSISYLYYFPSGSSARDFLLEALTNIRTFGYPLFLKAAAAINPGLRFLAPVQYLAHALAAWMFGIALARARVSRWAAFAAASALLYNNAALQYHNVILTESLSGALNIAVMASVLLLACNIRSKFMWALTAMLIFFSYQVRPINVSNIALAPALLFMLARMVPEAAVAPDKRRGGLRPALKLFLLNMVLLVSFCSFRFAIARDFGLVPFGGISLFGLAGQLMPADEAGEMPEDLRPLAEAIIANRRLLNHPDGFTELGWRDYWKLEKYYDSLTWAVSIPVACRMYKDRAGDNIVVKRLTSYHLTSEAVVIANKKLMKLSFEIIRRRPRLYAKIVAMTAAKAIIFQLRRIYETALIAPAAALAPLFILYAASARFAADVDRRRRFRFSLIMSAVALGYFAAQTLVMAAVQTPLRRYCVCSGLFIDAAILALLWDLAAGVYYQRGFFRAKASRA